jgi:hypothetical protein
MEHEQNLPPASKEAAIEKTDVAKTGTVQAD